MDEVERVISYIRSCREYGIDVTITIDKTRSHLILNALDKQIPQKTVIRINDEDTRIGTNVIFRAGTTVHYCPKCAKPVTGAKYCSSCGQALIW